MLTKIKFALSLLDKRSRFYIQTFALIRILIVGLDTLGVILIGVLVAKSADQISSESNSESSSFINFGDLIQKFTLIQLALFALILFTLKSVLSVFFTKLMAVVLAKAESNAASTIFNKLLNSKFISVSEFSRQDLIFSLTSSASFAITEMLTTFVTLLSEATLLIAMAILFAYIDTPVAIGIALYFGFVGFAIHRVIGPKMHDAGRMFAESSVKSNSAINDVMAAFREVRTLNKQREFAAKFKKGREGIAKPVAAVTFYSGLPRYIVETTLMFGAAFLAIYLFKTKDAATAAGILGIFLTGSVRIMASMLPLQNSLSNLKRLQASANPFYEVVNKVVDSDSSFNEKMKIKNNKSSPIGVLFDKVSFRYPGTESDIVKTVSFEIKPGEYIALVGPSGAGKSTIADLVIQLLEPSSGQIRFLNESSQSPSIGYVPQSPGIVAGSILENITLNVDSGEFDDELLASTLNKSHLMELINSLEDGLNTSLGPQSDGLSGGQIQRIGLARALYSNPGLLILDEATSALDAETEAAIAENLRLMKGTCTIIVIAHRLSTVKNADRVFVVDNGEVVAKGKFNELAKTNEILSKYVELSKLNVN